MKNSKYEDDGRQIVDMSSTYQSEYGMRMRRPKPKRKATTLNDEKKQEFIQEPELTKRETRQVVANAMFAALLIGAVFIGTAFLFVLFCVNVWFN